MVKDNFTINEHQANLILNTPRTIIKETNVFSDLKLSKPERLANARRILESWEKSKPV